ncbi:Sec-independent protein translocase protein TatB [Nereida sp. MMG025]|uniref:Sec-independent protein translocase protein TatB n=1 Tax=Nereida sp. MMG025 TaxID=2909981 RepID=UPI001F014EBF|nr:Sec-independent protein translocase protein TatB [Nereida sp. MMG025]MCF6445326.1 Sec-independent protein translocase protein TatB [Nereida sp. MMG025]
MFGLGWGEMIVVGIVALIVVGPKELPVMFRTMGRFMGKAKGMAREFTSAMNDAADSAGVRDIARDIQNATDARNLGLDKVKEAATKFESWEPKVDAKDGSETAKLSAERAEAAKKIHDYSAKKAAERKADDARKALADAEAELARANTSKSAPEEPKA